MSIKITIGHISMEYAIVSTTAPVAYDYGYVIPVQEGGGKRFVAMPLEHVEYQTARYSSGMYHHEIVDKAHLTRHVAEELFKRLFVKEGK